MVPDAFTLRVLAAYAAVYLIWGSTYLAIGTAVDAIPPFLMAGVRVLTAGGLLYAWARLRGVPAPTRPEWRGAALAGGLLLVAGTGSLAWAQQEVPSGLAALLVATIPLWVAILAPFLAPGERAGPLAVPGLLLGFGGVALLVDPTGDVGAGADPLHAGVILLASVSWAAGSLVGRRVAQPASHTLAVAMQMLLGGMCLVALGLATGEAARLDTASLAVEPLFALAYLIVAGSIVGFNAYAWLMKAEPPHRASSYAFVNPVIAVLLGWWLADEPLTPRLLVAGSIIVAAVALLTVSRRPRPASTARRGTASAGRETDIGPHAATPDTTPREGLPGPPSPVPRAPFPHGVDDA